MLESVSRAVVFGAYQLAIVLGIILLPAAIVTKRLGIPLPIHRLIRSLEALHDDLDDPAS